MGKELEIEKYPPEYKAYLRTENSLVAKFVKNTDSLLDIGCGEGRVIPFVARCVKKYTGIDTNKKYLKKARKASRKYKNVKLIWADAEEISSIFKKNEFEKSILTWNTLACIKNPEKALREISKVTKESCFVTVTAKGSLEKRKKYYEKLGIPCKIDRKSESIYSLAWGEVRAYSKKECLALFKKGGFKAEKFGSINNLMHYAILKKDRDS